MTQNRTSTLALICAVGASALLAACGPQDGAGTPAATKDTTLPTTKAAPRPEPARTAAVRGELGTVTAVVPIRTTAQPTGAGALIGGVVGAAVGNQVGNGNGRKLATVVGAVGGAAAGHHIEKDRNTRITGYRIDVKLENGGSTSVTQSQAGALAAGQRVRVVDGTLQPA